jgi:hypothetical protein
MMQAVDIAQIDGLRSKARDTVVSRLVGYARLSTDEQGTVRNWTNCAQPAAP